MVDFKKRLKKKIRGNQSFRLLTTLLTINLLYCTGVRVNELCSIHEDDIDFNNGKVLVLGKGRRHRYVYIPDDNVLQLIRTYLKIKTKRKFYQPTLLVNSRGNSASTQFIRLIIKNAAQQSGIHKTVTPHMLRHT